MPIRRGMHDCWASKLVSTYTPCTRRCTTHRSRRTTHLGEQIPPLHPCPTLVIGTEMGAIPPLAHDVGPSPLSECRPPLAVQQPLYRCRTRLLSETDAYPQRRQHGDGDTGLCAAVALSWYGHPRERQEDSRTLYHSRQPAEQSRLQHGAQHHVQAGDPDTDLTENDRGADHHQPLSLFISSLPPEVVTSTRSHRRTYLVHSW